MNTKYNHLKKIIADYQNKSIKNKVSLPCYPFITISREAGAGGHSLAEALIQHIKKDSFFTSSWEFYDQNIHTLINDPKIKIQWDELMTEKFHNEIEDYLNQLILGYTEQDIVYRNLFKSIRILAESGHVIFIGRGACWITRDLPMGIHLRLVAPKNIRIQRISNILNISKKDSRQLMEQQDKDRKKLFKKYFHKDINDPYLYDSVINTAKLNVNDIALSIIQLIKRKKI